MKCGWGIGQSHGVTCVLVTSSLYHWHCHSMIHVFLFIFSKSLVAELFERVCVSISPYLCGDTKYNIHNTTIIKSNSTI